MPYSQNLADRIQTRLQNLENIEEKEMMGGLCLMMNYKMCVGVIKDELLCRIDPPLSTVKPELSVILSST